MMWLIPVGITMWLWLGIAYWPMPPRSDYDFGYMFLGVIRLLGGVIGTLAVWMIFFMVT